MVAITFKLPSGELTTVETNVGNTVMEAAVANNIQGIDAECGGACACATCHVYVDEAWRPMTGEAKDIEADMLDFAVDPQEASRLACQIVLSETMEGATFVIPESQV